MVVLLFPNGQVIELVVVLFGTDQFAAEIEVTIVNGRVTVETTKDPLMGAAGADGCVGLNVLVDTTEIVVVEYKVLPPDIIENELVMVLM